MNRTYMIVFEKGNDCWGAFAPDVPDTGGMGDTIAEARESLREGIGYIFEHALETGLPIPEAKTTNVDFSEFDPNPSESHYEVEWLTVQIPQPASEIGDHAQQAA